METPLEQQLIRMAAGGDKRAYEELIAPLYRPALQLAVAMLPDPKEAEDAVQDAVLNAWLKLHTFRQGPMRPWFLTIVANRCRSLRRSARRVPLFAGWPQSASDDQDALVRTLDIRIALSRLNNKDRLMVVLHFYLDLPFDEIASITSSSPAAVRARTYRALARMRPHLAPELVG